MNNGEVNLGGDAEINEALKAFEAKSEPVVLPKNTSAGVVAAPMSTKEKGITFETDGWPAVKYYREATPPKIVRLVMKLSGGTIKEERNAYYVLLAFVILIISVSVFLLLRSLGLNNKLNPGTPVPISNLQFRNIPEGTEIRIYK